MIAKLLIKTKILVFFYMLLIVFVFLTSWTSKIPTPLTSDDTILQESKVILKNTSSNIVQDSIIQNILIHTYDNSRVERSDFYKYTNWYEESGNTQSFKLHPGDCNTRNDRKYCRIEAHTNLNMKKGDKHEFTATYNILKCEEIVCIFQVFNSTVVHPQLYIKILPNGDLRYQSRGNPDGLIDSNCINKEFTLHVKDDGNNWQLYYNGNRIAEGAHQEKGKESVCEFRWGLYNNNIPSSEIHSVVKNVIIK